MLNHIPETNLLHSVDLGKQNDQSEETVYSSESEVILALAQRIKDLEEFLDPFSYEDPRKLFGGTD
jgi:hypothetical protein